MTILEATVLLLLLLMALPDFCRRIHRPGLLYPLYIVAGVVAGSLMHDGARIVWREIGQFGFVLLLFSVGLEIELPGKRESLVALRRAFWWMAWQMPVLVGIAYLSGVTWPEGIVAGYALASTSVGMAYHLWEKHPFPGERSRIEFLEWIVAVEVLSILLLAVSGLALRGEAWWKVGLHLGGLIVAAIGAAFLALHLGPRLKAWLERGLNLPVQFVVLFIFAVSAVGERLGLSAPKTAFVLGMFISRSTELEAELNHRLEPLRDRLFVPVFFFGLGTLVEPRHLLTAVFPLAVGAGLLLFVARRIVYERTLARIWQTAPGAHLIAAPMLTIAAVAVEVLARADASSAVITWTLAGGLSLTLVAAFFRSGAQPSLSDLESEMAAPQAWHQFRPNRNPPRAPPQP